MIVCPGCGFGADDAFSFCPRCAARLHEPLARPQERRVVTSLVCDLVGFTAMGEIADPEDVDALLRRYHALAKKAIESHGGTMEKFIGDAVFAVFGIPTVHEDDPERAVRAALRLMDALDGETRPDGGPLLVRAGVNTGEALVRLDVAPDSGEGFIVGDAVNTAARLQAGAPPGGVVVGGATHDLTAPVFEYEELPPVVAAGKSAPVPAWLARAPRARRTADTDRTFVTPLVGRDVELAFLTGVFERAVSSGSPRCALLVGEPGIGKSRLVAELARVLDGRPDVVAWREGRCLPYGETATFGALAEIVRAHAGVVDEQDEVVVTERLDAVVPRDEDRAWLLNRLKALLGLDAPPGTREENFAAWTRALEAIAAARPAVLVFEDLHWADEALLDFLEYLVAHACDVPLLVLACARPELFERRAKFAGARFDKVGLQPLTHDETAGLVAGLLPAAGPAAGAEIVDRCGGNPFYAEQSALLLTGAGRATSVPGSVQAVIAARLDALPPAHKALLGDAACVGAVFWDEALAAVAGRDPDDVTAILDDLASTQLVRRVRVPAGGLKDVQEYVFTHGLARDVAYLQLPRAERARKHEAVARWLEAKAGDRAEDLSETLARHFGMAARLAQASDVADLAARAAGPAVHYLTSAGDRAYNTDLSAAEHAYREALGLAPKEGPERAVIEARLGEALLWSGQSAVALTLLERAVSVLRSTGGHRSTARALVSLARAHENIADDEPVEGLFLEALALLEDVVPSPELVRVLIEWGRYGANRSDMAPALAAFGRAVDVARQIDAPEPALALNLRACVLANQGSAECLTDFRRSLELARQQGLGVDRGRAWYNYAAFLCQIEGPSRSLEEYEEAMTFASSRGLTSLLTLNIVGRVESLAYAGRWAEAVAVADAVLASADPGSLSHLLLLRQVRLLVLTWQGRLEGATEELDSVLADCLDSPLGGDAALGLLCAAMAASRFDPGRADALLERMLPSSSRGEANWFGLLMAEAGRVAARGATAGLTERLLRCLGGTLPAVVLARDSFAPLIAERRGDHEVAAAGFAAAAAAWHDFGAPYEEGQALLGRGRCLAALGWEPEATSALAAAGEIFARLGAAPALEEAQAVLASMSSP